MSIAPMPAKRPLWVIAQNVCGIAVVVVALDHGLGAYAQADGLAASAASPITDWQPSNQQIERTAGRPFFGPNRRAICDSQYCPAAPHPAVARIIVPENVATAFGSGTLVDVRDQYGLVVTNWHVVRDSQGVVEVSFPCGFRSQARPLKVDSDWDLAALVIWRPPIEPVKLARQPPRPGDRLTIHGYGQGQYRIATGHCTAYYAPRMNFPQEMVELDVEARQGDSGGPIFNQSGELAGVLFGAGQGTTLGSFAPRVSNFLATLAPDIGQIDGTPLISEADRPAPNVRPTADDGSTWLANYPSSPWSPPAVATANDAEPLPGADEVTAQLASATIPQEAAQTPLSWDDLANCGWYERLKSTLAVVGLLAIAARLVHAVR